MNNKLQTNAGRIEKINTLSIEQENPLKGEIGADEPNRLPGDKSMSHRAALFASLAKGRSEIHNFQVSGVTKAMLNALSALSIEWELNGNNLSVNGHGLYDGNAGRPPEKIKLNCGNSATTMRLLAGALATTQRETILDGSEGLRRRPMARIVEPLQMMGVNIRSVDGHAPLTITPPEEPIHSILYELKVASAQVKSSILLAGLRADGETILYEPGPSRDHTERMLRGMGVQIIREVVIDGDGKEKFRTTLYPPEKMMLKPLETTLPGDISAAAFIIVAGLITPASEVVLHNVGLNPTRTGLLDVLIDMGADITITNQGISNGEPYGDILVRSSQLHGIKVSGSIVVRMIDEFPIFAVASVYALGDTIVSGAQELRHKETDRIATICNELSQIGVDIEETFDGFIIHGGNPITGGVVNSYGDHRLAMSLSIAGLISTNGVTVENAGILTESFPDFPHILKSLGAGVKIT